MPEPFRWAQGAHWPLLDGDSVGLARVRIEREKVETPLPASKRGQAGPLGLISVISPWLCLTRGGLEPFAGRPTNLGRSLLV